MFSALWMTGSSSPSTSVTGKDGRRKYYGESCGSVRKEGQKKTEQKQSDFPDCEYHFLGCRNVCDSLSALSGCDRFGLGSRRDRPGRGNLASGRIFPGGISLLNDEVIVYDEAQSTIEYLIMMK